MPRGNRGRKVLPMRTDQAALTELEAVVSRIPGAVLSGRTAGWLHGLDLAWKPIEVTVPDGHRSGRANVILRRAKLSTTEVVRLGHLPVTSGLRTAADLGRKLKQLEAIVALDLALHARLVTIEDLASYIARNRMAKGIGKLRMALELCDPNAESPMETRLRVLLCRAGLPRPESQVDLHDNAGRFVGRADFYYRQRRLAIEYDGATHRESLAEDNRRQNRLLEAGYDLLRFTGEDVQKTPGAIVAQVATALGVSARKRRLSDSELPLSARKPVVNGA